MKIHWLDEGDEVRYLGPRSDLRAGKGRVSALKADARPPAVVVDLGGAAHELPAWHLVRWSERAQHRHEKLAEGLHFFEWRGFENNCNATVLEGDGLIVIDPGHGHLMGSLLSAMAGADLDAADAGAVLLTHGHPDHIEGAEVLAAGGAAVGMSPREWEYLQGEGGMLFRFFGAELPQMRLAIELVPPAVEVLGVELRVMDTPGHSPGSVCLFEERTRALVVGDVVFPGGAFGRCDFPGGSYRTLLESFDAFDGLAPEFLLSGHGPPIAGRAEVSESIESSRGNLRSVVFSPW
jgi:glyoxylase-like metal-dependent hydrolase (beta-lactamase superfamily II)